MGRCDFTATGHGFNKDEAWNDAVRQADEYHGHEEGYSGAANSCDFDYPLKAECVKKPKTAKRCKVEKTPCKQTRKWETVFEIRPHWQMDMQPPFPWTRHTTVERKKQGEAIQVAKELSLKHQVEYAIVIRKKLVNANKLVAMVKPAKSEPGTWRFEGMART